MEFKIEEKTCHNLIEVLMINLFGESNREGAIYIGNFNKKDDAHLALLKIADTIGSLYGEKIYLQCSFWDYILILWNRKELFKRKKTIFRLKGYTARDASTWLEDISKAQGLDYRVWYEVWKYLSYEGYNSNENKE